MLSLPAESHSRTLKDAVKPGIRTAIAFSAMANRQERSACVIAHEWFHSCILKQAASVSCGERSAAGRSLQSIFS